MEIDEAVGELAIGGAAAVGVLVCVVLMLVNLRRKNYREVRFFGATSGLALLVVLIELFQLGWL